MTQPPIKPKTIRASTRLQPKTTIRRRSLAFWLGEGLYKTRSAIWKAIVFVSIILTVVVGLMYFLPSLTVDYSDLLEEGDPYSLKATITNTSAFPVLISVNLGLCKIKASLSFGIYSEATGPVANCGDESHITQFEVLPWKNHWLARSGGKYEIYLAEALEATVPNHIGKLRQDFEYADLSFLIYYKPLGVRPWPLAPFFESRLKAEKRNGKIVWTHKTIDRR